MYSLKEGDILPGTGIGVLRLGASFDQLRETIKDFETRDLPDYTLIVCTNVKIWVSKEKDAATQILVFGDFQGKYAGCIGIGSTLSDVRAWLGQSWHDDLDVTILDKVPGMGFELGSSDDEYEWDELTAPIECICVFPKE